MFAEQRINKVGTLGNDVSDPTCSILAVKSLNEPFTIVPFEEFELIVDPLLAEDVDAMVVPGAYPHIAKFIMNDLLVVSNVFTFVIPSLVFGSKEPAAKMEYETLYNHPATNALTNEINAKWGNQVNVSSNSVACLNGLMTKRNQNWAGHTVEVWQGSDENNLVLMTEMIYGGEGACPTCAGRGANPRVIVKHVDDRATRITENVYDWRGRLIETFGEEDANGQFVSTKNFYDNLGRTVKTEQFVNDAIESRLVARSESFYTPRGSAWCQTQSAADPAATNSGAGELVETKKSQTWFDVKGRQIKSFSACQCLTNVTTYPRFDNRVTFYEC